MREHEVYVQIELTYNDNISTSRLIHGDINNIENEINRLKKLCKLVKIRRVIGRSINH